MAEKLGDEFHQSFDANKVARKWQTLVDGYKSARDNNSRTGKAPLRYQYFTQMEDLIGGRHDIEFPVTATASGVVIHRPEEVGGSTPAQSTPRKRKRDETQNTLLQYLKDSDASAAAQRELLLQHMDQQQKSFEKMFMALLAKK